MIEKTPFGRTGHNSTRVIFGAAALAEVTQREADEAMELLLRFGVNHIDTARSYGEAELRLGPWMKHRRKEFFLASKTGERSRQGAMEELQQSLERLQTDCLDLWQLHCLVEPEETAAALGPGGAMEAMTEAKRQGLVKHIGVTGHGLGAPAALLEVLKTADFDSVLVPYTYVLMKQHSYAADVIDLLNLCGKKHIAVQTIKSLARNSGEGTTHPYATWYEPVDDPTVIRRMVQWVLSNPQVFLNSSGDIRLLPHILEAASQPIDLVTEEQLDELVLQHRIEPVFH